jgi:hypothetical protein
LNFLINFNFQKVPLKEIPSPVLEEVNEQTVFDLSSTEAEALAKKLLQVNLN